MKIEKISDTQIRCTLNKEDLVDRELRISELAYGSEKAKQLFKDMMQQASYEFGFEADDIPLMIEAIPVSAECLVLVITKVEDPDELDTRFSNFTPYADKDETIEEAEDDDAYADEILNCFEQIGELLGNRDPKEANRTNKDNKSKNKSNDATEDATKSPVNIAPNLSKTFTFRSLEEVISLSRIIAPFYHGINTLYKNPTNSKYYLVVQISDHTPEEFNKVCNIISEFGRTEHVNYASVSYYEEHFDKIVDKNAIQVLYKL